MNRRRFLKYVGATAVVVGASVLELDYLLSTPQIPGQQTVQNQPPPSSSLTRTSVSSTSSSPAQLASLQGRLCFDYNGNGILDTGEPTLDDIILKLQGSDGKAIAEAVTDSQGYYKLLGPQERYKLLIYPDQRFRYTFQSAEEFRPVEEGYEIVLNGPKQMDIGLAEGFLTLLIRPRLFLSRVLGYRTSA
ncbi:MAG: SdrD B-like domain-containing protein [Candidatus Bathyarchaeia archaeon]